MITLFLYNKDKKENENIKINLCFGHKKNNASNKVKYLISDKNDIPSFGKIEFNLTDDCPSKTKKTTNIHTLL